MLERHFEWTGILAEPLPSMHAALASNRRAVIDHRCVYSSRRRIDVLTVEHLGRPEGQAQLARLLAGHGYRQVCRAITRWDSWFVHERVDRCRWTDA